MRASAGTWTVDQGADTVLAILPTIFIAVVFVGVFSYFGIYILTPIMEATRNRRHVHSLQLADLFAISLLLALPFAVVSIFSERVSLPANVIAAVISLMLGWLGYRAATALSSLKINQTSHRLWIIGVIIPLSVIGSMGLAPASLIIVFYQPGLGAILIATTILLAYGGRKSTEHIVNNRPRHDGDDGQPILL